MAKRKSSKKKKQQKKQDISLIVVIILSVLLTVLIYAQSGAIGIALSDFFGGMIGILKYILHIKYGNKKSKQYINEISNISMFLLTFLCSIAILYFRNIAYFLICVVLWAITITENRKFKNDMKMYEIVQNQEKMEEILVLMNK